MKRFRMIDEALYDQIDAALEAATNDPGPASVARCSHTLATMRARFADGEGGGSTIAKPGEAP